jgi:hypothetical protein
VSNLIDEYREAVRMIYGNQVADNLTVEVKDGWYHVVFNEKPDNADLASLPARYRKTQLQATIANLRTRAAQSSQ